MIEIAEGPRLATVRRDLHPNHLAPAAVVRVALDRVRLLLKGDDLKVARVGNRRVDVQLVDDEVGLVPPPLSIGDLGSHVFGQHAVVVEVEKVWVRVSAREGEG